MQKNITLKFTNKHVCTIQPENLWQLEIPLLIHIFYESRQQDYFLFYITKSNYTNETFFLFIFCHIIIYIML